MCVVFLENNQKCISDCVDFLNH